MAIDTVMSSRGKSKGCLATLVERQPRFDVSVKIENRSATERSRLIRDLYEYFPKSTFKPYTVNSGKEFACDSKVDADLKVLVYFALGAEKVKRDVKHYMYRSISVELKKDDSEIIF